VDIEASKPASSIPIRYDIHYTCVPLASISCKSFS